MAITLLCGEPDLIRVGTEKTSEEPPFWNPSRFGFWGTVSAVALLLWVMPSLQRNLPGLDEAAFRWLNGSLAASLSWAKLWAFLNTRTFDLIAGVVMGLFFLAPGLTYRGVREWLTAGFEFLGTFLGFSLIRAVSSALTAPRPSPSRHFFPNFNSLTELVPTIDSKVFSDHSFPSDHAAVAFVWALFLFSNSRRPGRFLALPYALFLSTPRLVGGAHWLSDVLFGSVALAGLGFAFGYHTPLRLAGYRVAQTLLQRWDKKRSNPESV